MAMRCLKDDGVEQDQERVDYWTNKAAEQGHSDAMILSGNASGADKEDEFMEDVKRG